MIDSIVMRFVVPMTLMLIGNLFMARRIIYGSILRILSFLSLSINLWGEDLFNSMLVATSIVIGVVLALYTTSYSRSKYGTLTLVPIIDLLLLSILFTFISRNLIELVTFWLLGELLGFLLIAYDYIYKGDTISMAAAIKYLLFSMVPTDISLFILLAITGLTEAFTTPLKSLSLFITDPIVLILILFGFFAKAAIFPLHFWLPDAHSVAPSPASAILSGLMVKMGIYALYMLSFYSIDRALFSSIVLFSGLLTTLYGAMQASLQRDIKRLLAYSTTSETSIIAVLIALYVMSGDILFIEASTLYTVAHAIYKVSMFMDSGFIELVAHERDIRRLGYIYRISPTESLATLLSIMAVLGMPPSIGFLAKVFMFSAISHNITYSWIYVVVLVIAAVKVSLSIVYNIIYFKAHMDRREPMMTRLGLGDALQLQKYTLMISISSFIFTFTIYILNCMRYTELMLLRKLSYLLIISMTMFVALIYMLYNLIRHNIRS
ncbi:MAG: complex I subunit 5 family protein [Ignisphaera sp.]|uniref:NADH:quinone oxidoreductase/Mrp antiporter transmembrane domain-containing protein n=1 Tax=Ignisphaera aggregans TaxID=334771 RepID=A0A7J3MXI9_9CREN